MSSKNEIRVEVLRRSQNNAALVTDGVRAAWVQGRSVRADGTLTDWGRKIISESTMTDAEARNYDETIKRNRLQREKEKEAQKEAWLKSQKAEAVVRLKRCCWFGTAGKSFKIWLGQMTWNIYKKQVRAFVYLPQSLVHAQEDGMFVNLSMPTWIKNQYNWGTAIVE